MKLIVLSIFLILSLPFILSSKKDDDDDDDNHFIPKQPNSFCTDFDFIGNLHKNLIASSLLKFRTQYYEKHN